MNLKLDRQTIWLVGGVLALLVVSSLIGWLLSLQVTNDKGKATVQNLNARIRAWWMMVAVFGLAMATGGIGSIVLFALTSFLALREFITLTPTRPGDHRTLFWIFFIILPLQYYLIAIKWYGLFAILIPVYAFLFIPIRSAAAGDCENFLERTAKIQWGLMICVYCVSYVPALLSLNIPGYEGQNGKLMFYFVLVAQISDVLQYVWGKTLGRHKIAPDVSPNKTWEGFIGGIASATFNVRVLDFFQWAVRTSISESPAALTRPAVAAAAAPTTAELTNLRRFIVYLSKHHSEVGESIGDKIAGAPSCPRVQPLLSGMSLTGPSDLTSRPSRFP